MSVAQIALTIDIAAMALSFGATVWFFFIQSPLLLKKMGREKFVPLQMRMTVVLFDVLTLALALALALTLAFQPLTSSSVLTAGLAAFAVVVNNFFVVPRALRAGGRTRHEVQGKDREASTLGFASVGAGAGTKLYHRLVVLFVVVMLVGVVGHIAVTMGACS